MAKLTQLNNQQYDLRLLQNTTDIPPLLPRASATAKVTVDSTPLHPTDETFRPYAVVDGIQKAVAAFYHKGLYVTAGYTAAAAANSAGFPFLAYEQIHLYVPESLKDHLELLPLLDSFEHTIIEDPDIFQPTTADITEKLALQRQTNEHTIHAHLENNGSLAIIDGSLLNSPAFNRPNTIGVIKTSNTQYLPDETTLLGLQPGEVSSCFTIQHNDTPTYSCYMRLFRSPIWSTGLIRLESSSKEDLEKYAKTIYGLRQQSFSKDPRADRHLAPIRSLEGHLRTRAPSTFYK